MTRYFRGFVQSSSLFRFIVEIIFTARSFKHFFSFIFNFSCFENSTWILKNFYFLICSFAEDSLSVRLCKDRSVNFIFVFKPLLACFAFLFYLSYFLWFCTAKNVTIQIGIDRLFQLGFNCVHVFRRSFDCLHVLSSPSYCFNSYFRFELQP